MLVYGRSKCKQVFALITLFTLIAIACKKAEPERIVLVFPNTFTGTFEILATSNVSSTDRTALRTRKIHFPEDGKLQLSRDTINTLFGDWTEIRAQFENGMPIEYFEAGTVPGPRISRFSVDGSGSLEGFIER